MIRVKVHDVLWGTSLLMGPHLKLSKVSYNFWIFCILSVLQSHLLPDYIISPLYFYRVLHFVSNVFLALSPAVFSYWSFFTDFKELFTPNVVSLIQKLKGYHLPSFFCVFVCVCVFCVVHLFDILYFINLLALASH